MILIRRATDEDAALIAAIGKQTFLESHAHSASQHDVAYYIEKTFTIAAITTELNDATNIYHIIFYNGMAAGYSKIILHSAHPDIPFPAVTKLERIYILKKFYDVKAGYELLQFNIKLSKENIDCGIWLYVWKENQRAINFYIKNGFSIIGSYDFYLTPLHANPNHHMLLTY